MRKNHWLLIIWLLVCLSGGTAWAAKYTLKDGTVISGEAITFRQTGVAFRYDGSDGKTGFSPQIRWKDFSEDTLKELAKDPRAVPFVELLIELRDMDEVELAIPTRPPKPPIDLKPPVSPGRPHADVGMIAALTSGAGLFLMFLLYGGNIYAGWEIAAYRNWPRMMVCGASAVLPFLAPIVFVSMRTRRQVKEAQAARAEEEEMAVEPVMAFAQEMEAMPVEVVAAAPEPAALPETKVFKRGEYNLNRRFIETKFASFFRVIPSEADKDLLLVVKSARGEFNAKRVMKATNTEINLQVAMEHGTTEEVIPINDIFEIQVRHRDAPPV